MADFDDEPPFTERDRQFHSHGARAVYDQMVKRSGVQTERDYDMFAAGWREGIMAAWVSIRDLHPTLAKLADISHGRPMEFALRGPEKPKEPPPGWPVVQKAAPVRLYSSTGLEEEAVKPVQTTGRANPGAAQVLLVGRLPDEFGRRVEHFPDHFMGPR